MRAEGDLRSHRGLNDTQSLKRFYRHKTNVRRSMIEVMLLVLIVFSGVAYNQPIYGKYPDFQIEIRAVRDGT